MRDFDWLEPRNVVEASEWLGAWGDECRLMAGGTALMLALRQRMATPARIVSLAGIDHLRGIMRQADGGLRIGALTRHSEVAQSPLVQQHSPVLAGLAAHMANPQVRHQGTIGGNLCYADPATDPPGCLLALDARVVLGSVRGERVLPLQDFLVDYYSTALAPDELLVAIELPATPADQRARYVRHLRTAAEHRPLVNATAVVRADGDRCSAARLVIAASTPVPTRLHEAEACLQGRTVTAAVVAAAADAAAAEIEPLSDLRGSADYRRAMVRVVVQRNLRALFNLPQE